jgi:predicted transcriptional regulator
MAQVEKRYRRQFPAMVADVFSLAEGGVAAPAVAVAGAPGPLRPAQARLLTKDALRALEADPRQAVTEDAICCLICGRWLRQLTNTHLDAHETSAAEYKRRFGYNRRRPLMCLGLQRLYAERAVRVKLADHIRIRPVLIAPELRQRGGRRPIALEERLTRAEAQHRRPALAPAAEPAPLG